MHHLARRARARRQEPRSPDIASRAIMLRILRRLESPSHELQHRVRSADSNLRAGALGGIRTPDPRFRSLLAVLGTPGKRWPIGRGLCDTEVQFRPAGGDMAADHLQTKSVVNVSILALLAFASGPCADTWAASASRLAPMATMRYTTARHPRLRIAAEITQVFSALRRLGLTHRRSSGDSFRRAADLHRLHSPLHAFG